MATTPSTSALSKRQAAFLFLALVTATALRLGTWNGVFTDQGTLLDGTDGYYHLRRAYLVTQDWPAVIQFDRLMSVPEGARIQWPPLLDFLLGTVTKVLPGATESTLEIVGAWLPALFGVLQVVVLAWLLLRLGGVTAAVWGSLIAAVLPGVVRYGLLGALDHDPLIELLALLVLVAIAGPLSTARSTPRSLFRDAALIALALTALVLTWAGVVIHIGLVVVVVLAVASSARGEPQRLRQLGLALALGAGAAAVLVLPFVLTSVWTVTAGATFEGLSWLQEAALLGLGLLGALVALRWRSEGGFGRWPLLLALLCGTGFAILLPRTVSSLVEGISFLGRSEPFLEAVAESRPLLSLFGEFDLRPLLVRLSALPLIYPFLLPWLWRRLPSWPGRFVASWAVYTLAIALIQARYSHAAALAAAAVFGVTAAAIAEELRSQRRLARGIILTVVILIPSLSAYLSIPGFAGYRFYGRHDPLTTSGYRDLCEFLAGVAPSPGSWLHPEQSAEESVLAPWAAGHWIHWLGRKATVANPFGPQGQPGYRDGVRFYFVDNDDEAVAILSRRRVRWVVVDSDLVRLESAAKLAGLDPFPYLESSVDGARGVNLETLMQTVGARLAFAPMADGHQTVVRLTSSRQLREVYQSASTRLGPYGPVPWLRVYEVVDL